MVTALTTEILEEGVAHQVEDLGGGLGDLVEVRVEQLLLQPEEDEVNLLTASWVQQL